MAKRLVNEAFQLGNAKKKREEEKQIVQQNIENNQRTNDEIATELVLDRAKVILEKIFPGSELVKNGERWELVPTEKNIVYTTMLDDAYNHDTDYDVLVSLGGISINSKIEVCDNMALFHGDIVESLLKMIYDNVVILEDNSFFLLILSQTSPGEFVLNEIMENVPYIAVYSNGVCDSMNCDYVESNVHKFRDITNMVETYVHNLANAINSKLVSTRAGRLFTALVRYGNELIIRAQCEESVYNAKYKDTIKTAIENSLVRVGEVKKVRDFVKEIVSIKMSDKTVKSMNESFAGGNRNPLTLLSVFNTQYNYITDNKVGDAPERRGFQFLTKILGDNAYTKYTIGDNCRVYTTQEFDKLVKKYKTQIGGTYYNDMDDDMGVLLTSHADPTKLADFADQQIRYNMTRKDRRDIELRRAFHGNADKFQDKFGRSRRDDTRDMSRITAEIENLKKIKAEHSQGIEFIDSKTWGKTYQQTDPNGNTKFDGNAARVAEMVNSMFNNDTPILDNTGNHILNGLYTYESNYNADFPIVVICDDTFAIRYIMYNGEIQRFGGIHMSSYNVRGWKNTPDATTDEVAIEPRNANNKKPAKYSTLEVSEYRDYFTFVFGKIDYDEFESCCLTENSYNIQGRSNRFHGDDRIDGVVTQFGDFVEHSDVFAESAKAFRVIPLYENDVVSGVSLHIPTGRLGSIKESLRKFLDGRNIKFTHNSNGADIKFKINGPEDIQTLEDVILSTTFKKPFTDDMQDDTFEDVFKSTTLYLEDLTGVDVIKDIDTIIGYMQECFIICNYVEEAMGEDIPDNPMTKDYFGRDVDILPGAKRYVKQICKQSPIYQNAEKCLSKTLMELLFAYVNAVYALIGDNIEDGETILGRAKTNKVSEYNSLIKRLQRASAKLHDPEVVLGSEIPEYMNHIRSEYIGHSASEFKLDISKCGVIKDSSGTSYTKLIDILAPHYGKKSNMAAILAPAETLKRNLENVKDMNPEKAEELIADIDKAKATMMDSLNTIYDESNYYDATGKYDIIVDAVGVYKEEIARIERIAKANLLGHNRNSKRRR